MIKSVLSFVIFVVSPIWLLCIVPLWQFYVTKEIALEECLPSLFLLLAIYLVLSLYLLISYQWSERKDRKEKTREAQESLSPLCKLCGFPIVPRNVNDDPWVYARKNGFVHDRCLDGLSKKAKRWFLRKIGYRYSYYR